MFSGCSVNPLHKGPRFGERAWSNQRQSLLVIAPGFSVGWIGRAPARPDVSASRPASVCCFVRLPSSFQFG